MPRPPIARVVTLCGIAFALLASYEVARPATKSMFVTAHGAAAEPRAWLLVAATSLLVVAVYNRFAARVPLVRLLSACVLISAGLLVGLQAALASRVPGVHYALYVWRDLYIVVLIEAFWTFANSVFPLKSARWVYGLFLAAGSIGSFTGAELVARLARGYDTAAALWAVVPLLLLAFAGVLALSRGVGASPVPPPQAKPTFAESARVLRESPYLLHLLLLVLVIQFVVTLADFRLSLVVEATIADPDARTAAIAGVFRSVALGALALQLLTGPILRWVGVSGTLVAVPLLNATVLTAAAIEPRFAFVAAGLALPKLLDYSVFRAAKEMLYIPLTYAQKTQGKAVVDVLTYRVAKGLTALVVQGLVLAGLAAASGWIAVGALGVWLLLTLGIVRRWRRRAPEPA